MFARPRMLSLITTHQCTAACDHCCFGCSPRVTKAIPVERLHTLVDEAIAIDTIETVGFTGGECFLLGDALDDLIARATCGGLRTRVVTNAYWAVNHAAAAKRVARLQAAGLDEMLISTGSFHARWVPMTRVIDAARAAVAAEIATTIWVEECDQSTFDLGALRSAVGDLTAAARLAVRTSPWIPNAHGIGDAKLTHAPDRSRFLEGNKNGCESILNVLSVTPSQDLMACCGFTMEAIPDLCLGSVAERSIVDVLRTADDDFLKLWIHVEGPERILEFVKRHVPDYELPMSSADICSTCLHLHRDRIARRVVEEFGHEVHARVVNAFGSMMLAQAAHAPRRKPSGDREVTHGAFGDLSGASA
jgi:Radical SAM superfamily